jgi:hypothetical protein
MVCRSTSTLVDAEWAELLSLFQQIYDISLDSLQRSVRNRQDLYVIRERASGRLIGATTGAVAAIPLKDGRCPRVFYGGDSVFLPECRGLGLMQEMAFSALTRDFIRHPRAERYFFGGAGSYKMYLTVARSFVDMWPRRGVPIPDDMRELMDAVGQRMCGDAWRGADQLYTGARQWRDGHVKVTETELADPDVAFFVQQNSNHLQTAAVPMIARLDARNVMAIAKKLVSKYARLAGKPGAGGPSTRASAPRGGVAPAADLGPR